MGTMSYFMDIASIVEFNVLIVLLIWDVLSANKVICTLRIIFANIAQNNVPSVSARVFVQVAMLEKPASKNIRLLFRSKIN